MPEGTPAWLTLPEAEFQSQYRPAKVPTSSYLHRVLLRALGPIVEQLPADDDLRNKPLDVEVSAPLPARLRFYLYGATQHGSERQQGTFKVQLTSGIKRPGSNRLHFDRSGAVRPILMGYHPDHKLFILWDADLHDLGDGFPFSKSAQAPPDLIWGALARGIAQGSRRLQKPTVRESIIAARPPHLAAALELRIQLSNETLCGGIG